MLRNWRVNHLSICPSRPVNFNPALALLNLSCSSLHRQFRVRSGALLILLDTHLPAELEPGESLAIVEGTNDVLRPNVILINDEVHWKLKPHWHSVVRAPNAEIQLTDALPVSQFALKFEQVAELVYESTAYRCRHLEISVSGCHWRRKKAQKLDHLQSLCRRSWESSKFGGVLVAI